MLSIPYCSKHMPIGGYGLSMPTEVCSVQMPITLLILTSGMLNRTNCPIYDEGYTHPHSY